MPIYTPLRFRISPSPRNPKKIILARSAADGRVRASRTTSAAAPSQPPTATWPSCHRARAHIAGPRGPGAGPPRRPLGPEAPARRRPSSPPPAAAPPPFVASPGRRARLRRRPRASPAGAAAAASPSPAARRPPPRRRRPGNRRPALRSPRRRPLPPSPSSPVNSTAAASESVPDPDLDLGFFG